MDKLALKAKMIMNNDIGLTLAEALGISETTLSSKINEKTEFTRSEIAKIKERYKLSAEDVDRIFFDLQVT